MTIILVLIIVGMLAISALLAAIETAVTASSPGKMHKLKAEGNKRAAIVLNVLRVKEKVISTMLIGNSIANTVCTTIATGLFIDLLGDHVGTIVSSMVMAFTIIIFAEVVPKAIAVAKAEKLALLTSPTIIIILKFLEPINDLLHIMVRAFCFIFRIDLNQEVSGTDEVRGVIEHHHQEGNVYKMDRDMLEGILDIRNMTVSEIMVHRSNMVTINANSPTKQIIEYALASPNTRIPLWQDSKDNIIGILHLRDLLKALYDNNRNPEKVDINKLISEPWFIPDNALVIHQLNAFRERKSHFACVVDEYGDLQGIITLEDILEEIVGQISDEYDSVKDKIVRNSDYEFIIDGSVTIRDINRELNWNLPDDNATTIAGLIIHEMERIPNQEEALEIFNLRIKILKKAANKIETIQVVVLIPQDNLE